MVVKGTQPGKICCWKLSGVGLKKNQKETLFGYISMFRKAKKNALTRLL